MTEETRLDRIEQKMDNLIHAVDGLDDKIIGLDRKIDALIQAGNDRDQQITQLVTEMGKLQTPHPSVPEA